jgi:phage portal protein BeeE
MTLFDQIPPDEASRIGIRAATVAEKTATGPGVAMFNWGTPIGLFQHSPQKAMREAQMAYHSNPWIHSAEGTVTRRVVGLDWHLEDENDEEFPEPLTGHAKVAYDLLDKPQQNADLGRRMTRRSLWSITSRHVGLCGMAYWYLDQMDALAGIPLSILYINPARMWPAEDDNGNLTGWILDPKDDQGRGGTPLDLKEVIPFYLDEPDTGNLGTGLVEVATLKARITNLADMHAAYVLSTGGRLAGIVSPKEGSIPDDKFQALVREFRNLVEAPDAAKRTTILQGPVDFTPTAANPNELNLLDLSKMNRDDIFAIWGVPASQAGVSGIGIGMNSGETRKYEESILMTGAVHDRVVILSETIQYGLLDRFAKLGTTIELEIEEQEYNDNTPAYEMAAKARELPLTNRERRDLIGLDPFGNPEIDEAVWLPVGLTEAYPGGPDGPGSKPEPLPPPSGIAPPNPFMPANPPPGEPDVEGKSKIGDALTAAHDRYTKRAEAELERTIQGILDEQRKEIASRVQKNAGHLAKRPNDTSAWWDEDKWTKRLTDALVAHYAKTYQTVKEIVPSVLGTALVGSGKAVPARGNGDDVNAEEVRQIVAEMMGKANQPSATITTPIYLTAMMPSQMQPDIHITNEVPVPVVNVEAAKAADVTVNVAAADPAPPPSVIVNVPETKAAEITNVRIVDQPDVLKTVKRDPAGRIIEVKEGPIL